MLPAPPATVPLTQLLLHRAWPVPADDLPLKLVDDVHFVATLAAVAPTRQLVVLPVPYHPPNTVTDELPVLGRFVLDTELIFTYPPDNVTAFVNVDINPFTIDTA